jgi:hypothetical protein
MTSIIIPIRDFGTIGTTQIGMARRGTGIGMEKVIRKREEERKVRDLQERMVGESRVLANEGFAEYGSSTS